MPSQVLPRLCDAPSVPGGPDGLCGEWRLRLRVAESLPAAAAAVAGAGPGSADVVHGCALTLCGDPAWAVRRAAAAAVGRIVGAALGGDVPDGRTVDADAASQGGGEGARAEEAGPAGIGAGGPQGEGNGDAAGCAAGRVKLDATGIGRAAAGTSVAAEPEELRAWVAGLAGTAAREGTAGVLPLVAWLEGAAGRGTRADAALLAACRDAAAWAAGGR
jgi:hypothetical protein